MTDFSEADFLLSFADHGGALEVSVEVSALSSSVLVVYAPSALGTTVYRRRYSLLAGRFDMLRYMSDLAAWLWMMSRPVSSVDEDVTW